MVARIESAERVVNCDECVDGDGAAIAVTTGATGITATAIPGTSTKVVRVVGNDSGHIIFGAAGVDLAAADNYRFISGIPAYLQVSGFTHFRLITDGDSKTVWISKVA